MYQGLDTPLIRSILVIGQEPINPPAHIFGKSDPAEFVYVGEIITNSGTSIYHHFSTKTNSISVPFGPIKGDIVFESDKKSKYKGTTINLVRQ